MPSGLLLSFHASPIPPCIFLFLLSPDHAFLVFMPCPFARGIPLQAMIHYCPLMDYLWLGNDGNMLVEFEGYTVVVVS